MVLAHLYATEGLEGENLATFEAWRARATEEEKRLFAEWIDALAMVTLARSTETEPAPETRDAVLSRIRNQPEEPAPGDAEDAEDAEHFLGPDDGEWVPLPVPGVRVKELSARSGDGATVFLLEMKPGTEFPSHRHHGVEMTYLLEGDLDTGDRILHAGDFLREPAGSDHGKLRSEHGCRALLITASENFPRHTVSGMRRFRDVARAFRDIFVPGTGN